MARRRRDYPKITWSNSKNAFRGKLSVNGRIRDIYGKSEEEVMDKIDFIENDAAHGIDRSITFSEYAARWAAVKSTGLKPKSKDVYRNALKNHLLPTLGGLPICEIKPLHVDEMLAGLEGKSASIRSKALSTFSQIMESALENDLILKNPCRNKKAGGRPARIKTPLTRAQQDILCKAVEGTRAELFVLLCLYAGLRREEALGLLWGNVYLDAPAPYIDVRHTVTYEKGRPIHSDSLKTRAARRSIPIPSRLKNVLAREKEKAECMFVVPSVREKREMSLVAFRRMWNIATKATPFHIEPHQLRHTYITELCASGLDIKKIQYLAGHSRVQMTLNIYSHVTQNKPEQLAPAIITAFDGGKFGGNEKTKSL